MSTEEMTAQESIAKTNEFNAKLRKICKDVAAKKQSGQENNEDKS